MARYLFQGTYSREGAQGLLRGAGSWRTTVLLTAEEMDRVAKSGVGYRAPGS
jgi:hypothetical protein